jgi:hypothetical protein
MECHPSFILFSKLTSQWPKANRIRGEITKTGESTSKEENITGFFMYALRIALAL